MNSALVVGGGGGIGAGICEQLARTHSIAVGYHLNRRNAEQVAKRIQAVGGTAVVVGADLSTDDGARTAFDAAETLGTVHTVVHCAGAWDFTRVTDLNAEVIERDFRTNLESALLTLAESARRVTDRGRVVMLSSAAAHLAPARQITYSAMKAGVEAASRVAAKELGRRSITVNVVRPGATDTRRLHDSTSSGAVEAMAAAPALGRLGTPSDIASLVTWLTSDDAQWVTGAVIDANGGLF